MFEDKIEKLNQKLSERVDAPNTSFDKRTYTVEEVQNILLSGKLNDVPSGRLFRADLGFLQMCQSL